MTLWNIYWYHLIFNEIKKYILSTFKKVRSTNLIWVESLISDIEKSILSWYKNREMIKVYSEFIHWLVRCRNLSSIHLILCEIMKYPEIIYLQWDHETFCIGLFFGTWITTRIWKTFRELIKSIRSSPNI